MRTLGKGGELTLLVLNGSGYRGDPERSIGTGGEAQERFARQPLRLCYSFPLVVGIFGKPSGKGRSPCYPFCIYPYIGDGGYR